MMRILNISRLARLTLAFSLFMILFSSGARADMVMLSPVSDTYVDSENSTSTYGQDPLLVSRFEAKYDRRSQPFLKFDLSLIPVGSTVNEATLKLYLKSMTDRDAVELEAFRATSDWSEETLAWNSRPTGPGIETKATVSDNKGNKNIDLTAFVVGWLAGTFPNYGLFLDYAGNKTYSVVFSSSEAPKNQPYLVIYYSPPVSGTGGPPVGLSMAEGKPPAIIDVKVSQVTDTTVTVSWTTDMKADSSVKFGTSAAYDFEIKSNKDVTSHSIVLRGLTPGTRYHYRTFSESPANMEASSADLEFKTVGGTPKSSVLPSTPFGWLKLIGILAGCVTLFLLSIVGVVELQRWRRSRAVKTAS